MLQGEGNTLFCELDYLGIGVSGGGPVLYVRGLGPPAVSLMVVDDAHVLHRSSSSEWLSGLVFGKPNLPDENLADQADGDRHLVVEREGQGWTAWGLQPAVRA